MWKAANSNWTKPNQTKPNQIKKKKKKLCQVRKKVEREKKYRGTCSKNVNCVRGKKRSYTERARQKKTNWITNEIFRKNHFILLFFHSRLHVNCVFYVCLCVSGWMLLLLFQLLMLMLLCVFFFFHMHDTYCLLRITSFSVVLLLLPLLIIIVVIIVLMSCQLYLKFSV